MEIDSEYAAKIIGKDKEFFLSKFPTILGRSEEKIFSMSDEIKGSKYIIYFNKKWIDFFIDKLGIENFEEIERINLDENKKISKTHAIITYDENKKLFEITNLSKNLIFVNKNFVSQFESVKIKNKNVMIIGREMFFFVYSKIALLNYYKSRLEKMSKIKEKFSSRNLVKSANNNNNISVIVDVPQPQSEIKVNQKKNKKRIPTNSQFNLNLKIREERLNNSAYNFENILPPNPESIFNKESDNILDDLIESTNSKIRINNKSVFQL